MKNKNLSKIGAQRAMALLVSLFCLLGVLIASASLIKFADTSLFVSGNVAERSIVYQSNDIGVLQARDSLYLMNSNAPEDLYENITDKGYFATFDLSTDIRSEDLWDNAQTVSDASGNSIDYLIFRMCEKSGAPSTAGGLENVCAIKKLPASVFASTEGNAVGAEGSKGGDTPFDSETGDTTINVNIVYYKVFTRTRGTKDSKSFADTIVGMSYAD